jgi:ABC-type nickel/cobalt efflux system permease component RcnA
LTSILLLGFVIGMQHAFEADHLAAVSTLISRRKSLREMSRHGALWGLGHTVALVMLSGLVLFSPWKLPVRFAPTLELIVGLMLVALGSQLLYRLWRDRVHIHAHDHDGDLHLHAHSHRDDPKSHAKSEHDHEHHGLNWKMLLVGITHGAAGSAALTVFVAASLESATAGLAYVAIFGLGSIVGMATLSAAIALPLTATAKRLTWANRALQIVAGTVSIGIGLRLAVLQLGVLLG